MKRLLGKTAVITGSSTGIGKAIATLFAKEGANIIICSNSSEEEGKHTLNYIKNNYEVNAEYYSFDIREEEAICDFFSEIKNKYDSIDILINNAGRTFNVPFEEITQETLINDINTNLVSTILCCKYAVPLMTNQNGWIVNTSSIRGIDYAGRPGIIGYCAAKSGINSLTKTLAYNLSPNIFVNAVAPGFVHTGYIDRMDKDSVKAWLNDIPINRLIQPEEIAEVYLMLSISKIFTGSIVSPDGGYALLGR